MAYLSWTVASLILGRGMPSLLAGLPGPDTTAACKLDHGRLGPLPRPGLVDYLALVDLAKWRRLFWCAREQLLRMVLNRVCFLSIVHALSRRLLTQLRAIAA